MKQAAAIAALALAAGSAVQQSAYGQCGGVNWTGTAATTSKTTTTKTTTTKASSIKSSSTKTTKATKTSTTKTSSAKPTTTTLSTKTTTKATTTTTGGGSGGGGCLVTAYASISAAVKSCTLLTLSNISAPPSSSIDLQKLQPSATVVFAGLSTFGVTVNNDFDPIIISGSNILITGAPGHVIDGGGPNYWDGQGSNGGGDKPDHFIVVKKTSNARITDLNIKNWPVHCFSMTGNQGLTVSGLNLDNSDGDAANSKSGGKAAAHNSDGFDISSSDYVTLENINVHNQDDCVAVTSGTHITVTGMYCYGGHGLSIGSIGGKSNNTVDTVTFQNSQIINSENGCRIKTNSGTTGTVKNIIYKSITLSGISDYGIDVQ
ncbi:Polygalacturonase [Drechslerella dactyloides]|uniref:endo-polygalacturonase n=1 Tax=Drechslerella dactyloides TaxID=74499 RepID=A0AAD6J083_DREDA|nr:Polygalacturonase [Drechslerella dactyloides]